MKGPNATWRDFLSLTRVEETGSTNTDLLAAAANGARHGAVLVADFQTAGRGRLDRTWEAPPGVNLLMSVLFRNDLEPFHNLTRRVSLAALVACEQVAGVRPTLKWPNDLLLDGRKLAGVLAQAGGRAGRVDYVVVGIGINVGWAPEGAARLPVGTRDDVLDALLTALCDLDGDTTAIYRDRLSTLGEMVRIEMPAETFVGRAMDVDESGALSVETTSGVRVVSIGDVTHLRPV
jgi:BirA family transcriptional regulator, biotin operon repressor / biotin---[acetyl-CoA-carboxylase] ligase